MGQGQEGDCTLKSPRDTVSTREVLIRRGVWLEIGTVAWNAIEGIIAVAAGIVASSVALVGFGVRAVVAPRAFGCARRLNLPSERRDRDGAARR